MIDKIIIQNSCEFFLMIFGVFIMKKEFSGYYSATESEYEELWDKAIFVPDANVLLSLYRYQKSTTKQLIDIFKILENRIWVPYHVALEYQRNRLQVIAEQNKKFSEVKGIVNNGISTIKKDLDKLILKKRHSTIEPNDFLSEIEKAAKNFLNELEGLENDHFSVIGQDFIREELDRILEGKVGPKPKCQSDITELEKMLRSASIKKFLLVIWMIRKALLGILYLHIPILHTISSIVTTWCGHRLCHMLKVKN